jgi:hypothetical protein
MVSKKKTVLTSPCMITDPGAANQRSNCFVQAWKSTWGDESMLVTCWKGYRSAVNKRFNEHRKWMIRSFGITLVAVSGRVLVPVLLLTYYTLNGFSLPGGRKMMVEEVLNINIWAGLILNFIIVEWFILKSDKVKKKK